MQLTNEALLAVCTNCPRVAQLSLNSLDKLNMEGLSLIPKYSCDLKVRGRGLDLCVWNSCNVM